MKKAALFLGMMVMGMMSFAQNGAIAKYFQSYSDSEDYTKINVSSKMFELFAHLDAESEEDQEMLKTISNLDGMKMIVTDKSADGKSLYKEAIKKPGSEYEILMTVEDNDEDLTFFIKEGNGVINELVLIGGGIDNFFVMSLTGIIDLKQISKLSRSVQMNGMDHLKLIEK